jgi:hypothetical protein
MTDKSLADAIRQRVDELNGEAKKGDYCYYKRGRVNPWGDNQSVEAAMLEIADVIDEWSREGKYNEQAD